MARRRAIVDKGDWAIVDRHFALLLSPDPRCGTRGTDTCLHEQLPWGTVSAEIMQPSARLFWYAYGWPCGQPPEHGDQIYQDKSWGRFVPFDLAGDECKLREVTAITTTQGAITSSGLACQAAQEAATPVG